MKQPISLYYLYCINRRCQVSVYHCMVDVKIAFTAENLGAIHICTCCNQKLVSAIDLEIARTCKAVNYMKADSAHF